MQRYIEWTEAISVKEPVLDAQHRQVFDIINDLYVMGTSAPRAEVLRILRRLKFFTLTHLRCEEEYIRCSECPFFEEHKAAHRKMAASVERYIADYHRGQLDLTELLAFLKTWWLGHIRTADAEYVPMLPAIGDSDP